MQPRASLRRLSPTAAALIAAMIAGWLAASAARAEWIWVEGEKPAKASMNRHPWWFDKVHKNQLSGGDLISNFDKDKVGEAEYRATARAKGKFDFWVRANPVQAKLAYQLNNGDWTEIDLSQNQLGNSNIAEDDKPDLRFIAWVKVGRVDLKKGANTLRFKMHGGENHHGYLDCFLLTTEPFQPRGILKPDQIAADAERLAAEDKGWFAFSPPNDPFEPASGFDLRALNEKRAGDGGFIGVKGSQFVHGKTGKTLRFWAVNGPPRELKDRDLLKQLARRLAKYGVNLVRIHGGYFDENGEVDQAAVKHALDIVECMKEEGIYSHFSIYFPLWLKPKPSTAWLAGYDGNHIPFAALYFNDDFQRQYQGWWKALLLTKNSETGKRLIDEPAVAGVELVNEDSYFFWTFNAENVPSAQRRIVETQFGDWLKRKYGTLDKALARWNGPAADGDAPAAGRIGFRPLWNMFNEKTRRDQDATRFLVESQRGFYQRHYQFLRGLGFRGMITASNWVTASPRVLTPLEKYSYTVGDFIDRHGYFGCRNQGPQSEWSVQNGHTYADRGALRFDAEEAGKPKLFVHPAMDPSYDGKPSMISETTFNRPNRFRSEAPLYYAVYGALQDSDAVVHFALDSASWSVKPGYFMQPWTVMTPAMMGQFPAAAMIYRQGLVRPGEVLVDLNLKLDDLLDLAGTPLEQDASFDELRAKDVPQGLSLSPGDVIDPLVHYAGRTNVNFTAGGGAARLTELAPYIDRGKQTVRSTTGELRLDYGKGVLTIDAPAAQGASGALAELGKVELAELVIASEMSLGHIVAVSLDGRPLDRSRGILLQVMSEEKASGFQTEPGADGATRIVEIGHDPWLVKDLQGSVRFKRADAGQLKVTALDANGYPREAAGTAAEIKLRRETMYYLIAK
ncbi:MAG TPA: hypothetical protein VMV69_13555 [Pirellulales bacterium]|nr:hypothetical protein [Pirellulales bacterium]